MLYYSPSANSRFDSEIHTKAQIPEDAYEITKADFDAMMDGQTAGKLIVAVNGKWALVDRPPLSRDTLFSIMRSERNRLLDIAGKAIQRHRDQREMEVETTITNDQYRALLIYAQALRDLPETVTDPTPGAFTWPESPID